MTSHFPLQPLFLGLHDETFPETLSNPLDQAEGPPAKLVFRTRKDTEVLSFGSSGRMFGNPRSSDLYGGHMLCPCCVHTVVVLTRKGGAYVRGVGQISALIGVFALSRLAELFMRAQCPVSPVEPTFLLLCNLVL